MIRILNAEPAQYSEEARAILETIGQVDAIALDRAGLLAQIGAYDVLIVRLGLRVDRQVISTGSRLRVIVSATTGLDHIDLAFAQERGVAVLSLRGEVEFLQTVTATAEMTWALLLSLVRRVPWAFQDVTAGRWQRDLFRGNDLQGRCLGILGLGRVGTQVAHFGHAFRMRVFAFDPFRTTWPAGIARVDSAEELAAHADVFTIHIPLGDETRGVVDMALLKCMPPGAVLVNTARGAIVDESALIEALTSGGLAGAAVDVLADESDAAGSQLVTYARSHNNLLISPHIAGATMESMASTEVFMAKKLARFLVGT